MGDLPVVNDSLAVVEAGSAPPKLPSGWDNSDRTFLRQCIDKIVLIARLYGFDSSGYKLGPTYRKWEECCVSAGVQPMKYVKWKIAAFFACQFPLPTDGQAVPPMKFMGVMDKPQHLLCGRAGRYLNTYLKNTDREKFRSFCVSVLYSKKGMPRPTPKQVAKSVDDAFVKLTTPIPTPGDAVAISAPTLLGTKWGDMKASVVSDDLSRERIEYEIGRVVQEVFGKLEYTDDDRVRLFFPSTSANYVNTRAKGGIIGMLLNPKDSTNEDEGSYSEIINGLRGPEPLIQHLTTSLDEAGLGDMPFNKIRHKYPVSQFDISRLQDKWATLMNRVKQYAVTEKPTAKLVGLAEALKVRVISKGPGLTYMLLKPLQMFLREHLSRHRTFRFTGQPVSQSEIQDILGSKLPSTESFLSVDYSDATNEIASWASDCAMNEISRVLKLTPEESMLALTSLTGHVIEHAKQQRPQLNGQLMGGILSFPILCIVNAAILRATLEISRGRKIKLADAPLTVNGDDAVLKVSTVGGYQIWERLGRIAGLNPSPGKVYFSREFLNMNSTTYTFKPIAERTFIARRSNPQPGDSIYVERPLHFELVKYVNLGLLYNMKRSTVKDTDDDDSHSGTLGARCRELINSCPDAIQEALLGQFIHINQDKITVKLPYFVPEELGGLGLPSVGKYRSSEADARFARLIYENPDKYPLPQRPLSDVWQTWKYATKHLPSKIYRSPEPGVGGNWTTVTNVTAMLCIEGLFRCSSISQLMTEAEVGKPVFLRYYRQLSKIWQRAREAGHPPRAWLETIDWKVEDGTPLSTSDLDTVRWDVYNTRIRGDKYWFPRVISGDNRANVLMFRNNAAQVKGPSPAHNVATNGPSAVDSIEELNQICEKMNIKLIAE
jgi:hypothetical protein